jgi:hypothetical protein
MSSLQDEYADMLSNNVVVHDLLENILHDNVTGPQAAELFHQAISHAVHELALNHRGIVHNGSSAGSDHRPNGARPTNRWFNDECKHFKREVRDAERYCGVHSPQAVIARHLLHACVKRTKRCFEEQRILETAEQWFKEPRRFWSSYKDTLKGCSISDVGEWSAYFKALYTGGNATHPYHSDELNEHLANFAHAFMEGSEEAKLAAQVLNSPFTEQEVQSALDKMSDGKAAGIDGVPAEFLTHACLSEQGAPNVLATYPPHTHVQFGHAR